MRRRWACAPLAALCVPLMALAPAMARAEPVVQPTGQMAEQARGGAAPGGTTAQALDAALERLARNPRDIDSLVAAGRAALAMGDTDAAIGFFSRADKLARGTPRVLAGLAVAKVRAHDPLAAMPLFDAADTGRPLSADDTADRGLAYDLVGDNRTAQTYYRRALAAAGNGVAGGLAQPEAARRLVLSCAIAGDRAGSDAALRPLLDAQDRAATRTQAFALAILGREEEAVAVVRATMSPDLAAAIAPYLRYMRRLTPAQQAAAANLGEFPHAADIGVDDPRIAQYAAEHHLHPAATQIAQAPVVAAAPRGNSRAERARRREAPAPEPVAANASPPELSSESGPSREDRVAVADSAPAAAPEVVTPPPAPASLPAYRAPAPAASARPYGPVDDGQRPANAAPPAAQATYSLPPSPAAAPASVSIPVVQRTPAPMASARAPAPAPTSAATPASTPAPTPALARRRINFADAFATMGENAPVFEPAPGAVDIRKIAPAHAARPVPHAAPKPPPPPPNPSRIWVELGVGRDTDRLGFDWHRMAKDDPDLFARRKPFVTGWVRTNRLLTGPFDTQAAADTFAQQVRKAGHDGVFVWTSPAGQVVDPLDAR